MKSISNTSLLLLILSLLGKIPESNSQNVGIGTNTPTGPLSFNSSVGNKIVLWGDGSANHYGIGLQSGLLQIYANQSSDAIAFGIGRSGAFTERMRILNTGYDGMVLNGRLVLKNGSNDPVFGGGGVWLYKADNSAVLGFMGSQNNQNIGFYGGPLGWGFTYDALTSRVGIGNNNPTASFMISTSVNPQMHIQQTNAADFARIRMQSGSARFWDIAAFNGATVATDRLNLFHNQAGDVISLTGNGNVGIGNTNPTAPLTFAAVGGKKIVLYPGTVGDAGFGIASNRLQIFSDNPNADVAIGYDAAGVFNERLAVKPNGALALSGNTGQAGQVPTSNGSGAAASWSGPGSLMPWYSTKDDLLLSTNDVVNLTDATINFSTTRPTRCILWIGTTTVTNCVIGPCVSAWLLTVFLDGKWVEDYSIQGTTVPAQNYHDGMQGPYAFEVGAGNHSLTFTAQNKVLNPMVYVKPLLLTLPM